MSLVEHESWSARQYGARSVLVAIDGTEWSTARMALDFGWAIAAGVLWGQNQVAEDCGHWDMHAPWLGSGQS